MRSGTIERVDYEAPRLPGDLERIASLFDLRGRTALVTGAAGGIGRAIALGLAHFGADVAVADIDLGGVESTARTARELGRRATAIRVDVTDWSSVEAMAGEAAAGLGRIDIAFNVPGINIRKPALDLAPDEFRRIVDVNLIGVFHCAKAVGALMVRQGAGRMINVASIHGHVGGEGQGGYAASKHGVIGLTQVLALEWAPYNVRVNALSPGHVHTNLVVPLVADRDTYQRLLSRYPVGRFAEPWEIVGPALFLASDASTFVTGTSLLVDGGRTAG